MGAVFFQAFFLELLIVSCGSFVLVALIIAPLTEFRQKGFFAGEVFTDRVAEPRKNIAGFRDSGKLSTRILASGAVAENQKSKTFWQLCRFSLPGAWLVCHSGVVWFEGLFKSLGLFSI